MQLLSCLVILLPTVCSAWHFPFFTSDKDSQITIHPKSPKEADPFVVRTKRQAYQVYVGDDVSVTVDKSGKAETGPWEDWIASQECSRTCGGGVQIEKRQCSGDCTGPSVRYVSCNIQECGPTSKDFRSEQCSRHDDTPLDGNYYRWLPYPGKNKCELTCKPDNANFYYKWADKVVDGTPCDTTRPDICVEGVCLPLGCDRKLGSAMKDDKCGVCGGDGSTCKTVEGFFDERNLSPGYHNIIKLPIGATSIKVEEMRPTTNSLAIKNESNYFYLNGNYQIQVIDKDLHIAGTVFQYDNPKTGHSFEKLTAKGPINEELTIALLFQSGNKDSAIKYEFSVPLDEDVPYVYKPGEWSGCSVTCGKGVESRIPYCVDENQQRVNDELCDEYNATKPELERPCETVDCEAEWFIGEWEQCSETCGNIGLQYRVVYCHRVLADGNRMTVDDSNCTAQRPDVQQRCNRFVCPEWQAGPWSACSEKCGDAFQYRSVTCRSEKEGEEGKLLPGEMCGPLELETQRGCNLGPCEGLSFHTTKWKLCEKCNDTEETREVTCRDKNGRQYPIEKCLSNSSIEIPIDKRACATPAPCVYEWHASQWSKCSTECGHGHKTRRVVCGIYQLGDLEIVDEFHCNADLKLKTEENCTNEEKCTGTYYTGPWSECTAQCGGGTQSRMIVCLNYDKIPVPEWCDESDKPAEEQTCNTDPCPTCDDSEFGCCPDNTTFATGAFMEGCSNCSQSEFGCCSDNVTYAEGANMEGCPDYETGSGEDVDVLNATKADEAKIEMCEVSNAETGESATVQCAPASALNETIEIEDLLDNITARNESEHCSKSEFGCCPDWYTPATGKDNEGCPIFTQGACNDTMHGCCPDEVTLARGPNYEGCGEPSCAASLYGCCKDRKTIAFGPHYAGCDRTSFPCELSKYGCCSDGETAALGSNGTGCGEDCLLSKYGCCPDGVTSAKSVHNDGCGCQYSQYGCCPDGKTAAQGAGFIGCPDSCAQSQFGCCPDGKTMARGPKKEGCPCQYTRYGCCPDGETAALGPRNEGCDDCRYAKYGCCPDGETRATGPEFAGCPVTTIAPYIFDGTVAPSRIVSCALPQDQGTVCHPGYKLVWYYDSSEGRCTQFWYGGCDGNENNFASKEQCETICVEPPERGRCYLPKVEGPIRCDQLAARYWYDYTTKQCGAFWWRGCLGNANNFESWEECQTFCQGVGPIESTSEIPERDNVLDESPYPHDSRYPEQTQSDSHRDHSPQVYKHPRQEEPRILPQGYPSRPYERNQSYREPPSYSQLQEESASRIAEEPRPLPASDRDRYDIIETTTHQPTSDICSLPADVGPCRTPTPAYYYDSALGSCVEFTYGGCEGNNNRFESMEECQNACRTQPQHQALTMPDGEVQPPERSASSEVHEKPNKESYELDQPSEANIDGKSRREEVFTISTRRRTYPLPSSPVPELCQLPEDIGPCYGRTLRWRFDSETQACVTFAYSGCGGNANMFTSQEACERACGPFRDQASDVCGMEMDRGSCELGLTRWYYDTRLRECHPFMYSGCGGNGNRFSTKAECENLCAAESTNKDDDEDVCSLERDSGPCTDPLTQWYFDSNDMECKLFTYGGCRGNKNRFDTRRQCERRCLPSSMKAEVFNASEACSLPFEAGPCRDSQQKWYYDNTSGKCRLFVYGGCMGNLNRFDSEHECTAACLQTDQKIDVFRATVKETRSSPHSVGSDVDVECETNGLTPVRWFKNGEEINFDSNSYSQLQLTTGNSRLTIKDAKTSDSGSYACSAGPTTILSDPIKIIVEGRLLPDSCVDEGNEATCRLVVKANLCTNVRYGRFCCRSCSAVGYSFRF